MTRLLLILLTPFLSPVRSQDASGEQTANQTLQDAYDKFRITQDVLMEVPLHLLTISYSDGPVPLGAALRAPARAAVPPLVQWDCNDTMFYTLIMVDPDAVGTSPGRQQLQWWVDGIPGCSVSRGFTQAPYLPPAPPPLSGTHRYCFYVFQNTDDLTPSFTVSISSKTGLLFSTQEFSLKYGPPWAGTFFLAESMSVSSTAMLAEVTSQASLGACRLAMDRLLQECLMLGLGETVDGFHSLTVQQVKVVDTEGNLKNVYPSRTDCVYEGDNIKILRSSKK